MEIQAKGFSTREKLDKHVKQNKEGITAIVGTKEELLKLHLKQGLTVWGIEVKEQ